MESELKQLKPVTAYAMLLCSHANCRLLFKRFNEVCKEEDEKKSEMLAHHLALHTRIHHQCIQDVVLALVKQCKKGGTLSKEMASKGMELEEMLETLEKTKKDPKNEEFVELMQEMEKACEEQMEQEEEVLEEVTKEVDEEALIKAAERMESVKLSMSLAQLKPQKMAYA